MQRLMHLYYIPKSGCYQPQSGKCNHICTGWVRLVRNGTVSNENGLVRWWKSGYAYLPDFALKCSKKTKQKY